MSLNVYLLAGIICWTAWTESADVKFVSPMFGSVVRNDKLSAIVSCTLTEPESVQLALSLNEQIVAQPVLDSLKVGSTRVQFDLDSLVDGFYNVSVSSSGGGTADVVHFEVRLPRVVPYNCPDPIRTNTNNKSPEELANLVNALLLRATKEEKSPQAECFLEACAVISPNSVDVLLKWAIERAKTSLSDALELVARALARDPSLPSAHYYRATYLNLFEQHNPGQTITNRPSLLENAAHSAQLASADGDADSLHLWAMTLVKARGCTAPGVVAALERLLAARPDNFEANRVLARCYFNSNLWDKRALPLAKKAIELQPNNLEGYRFMYKLFRFHDMTGDSSALPYYDQGVKLGLYQHPLQRPIAGMVFGIPSLPVHDNNQFPWVREFEANYKIIRAEALKVLKENKIEFYNQAEFTETMPLAVGGEWRKYDLFYNGFKNSNNTDRMPATTAIIEKVQDAMSCVHGSIKLSLVLPGTHIKSHCGPTNARLRMHLTLVEAEGAYIRVGEEKNKLYWREGRAFVFDDSFEHEVFHEGRGERLILIMDFWPPSMTVKQRVESIKDPSLFAVYNHYLKTGKIPEISEQFNMKDHPRHDPANPSYHKYLKLRDQHAQLTPTPHAQTRQDRDSVDPAAGGGTTRSQNVHSMEGARGVTDVTTDTLVYDTEEDEGQFLHVEL